MNLSYLWWRPLVVVTKNLNQKYLNCTYANGEYQRRTMTDKISIQQSAKIINTSHNFHIIVTLHLTTYPIHTIYPIKTTTTMSTKVVHTMMDKKMESSMHLSAIGAVIPDATKVLLNAVSAMQDKSISRNNLLKHASTLKKLIVPLLQQTSVDVKEASQSLGPIPSVGYAHRREQNKRKWSAKLQTTLTSKEEENIFVFLQGKQSTEENDNLSPPPSKRPRRSTVTPSPAKNNDDILPPIDRAYDRAEVAKMLSTTRASTKKRGDLMRRIIKHQKQFGVPCHQRTLERLMNAFEKGRLIYGEFVMGRPPLMSNKEIEEAINHFQKRNGASLTKEDVRQIICKARNTRLEAAGFKVLDDGNITAQSVANYTAYIAVQPGMSIAASTTVKTSTRYAAENSIRGAISLLSIIASTHFIPVNEEDPETRRILKDVKEKHPEIIELTEMVSKALGVAVFPVLPQYIYSTDDTTEYIYEGTKNDTPTFVLTSKKSIAEKGTKSVHRVEDNKSMSGMRVKLTFTFSAAGTCFPLVVTVTGLTDRELPNGEDFVHVEVPGLCIGGGGVTVGNQGIGHVLFMKSTEGAEKKRFEWYQREVLIKGVNDHRHTFAGYDASTSSDCPDNLTAVSWCDGDLSQIHAITKGTEELSKHKIVANKQHAARSAVEQPADLSKVFMLIKKELPHYSVSNVATSMCPMKKLLTESFDSVLKCVNLQSGKRRHLIDFLCVLPDIVNRCCTQKHIRQGFIEAGMIDKVAMRFPVFNKILATCRRNPEKTEYDVIKSNFATFFEAACEDGLVPEQLYEDLVIRRDSNIHGDDVLRNCTISQESRQRSKCLTHHNQVHLREERLLNLRLEASTKKNIANLKHQELVAKVDEAEKELLKKLADGGGEIDDGGGEVDKS